MLNIILCYDVRCGYELSSVVETDTYCGDRLLTNNKADDKINHIKYERAINERKSQNIMLRV